MKIKVITTRGDNDNNPTVNWIGPDPEMKAFQILPEGTVPDMTLIHYDEVHYNLVISKDSDLAKVGTLSQWFNETDADIKVSDDEVKEKDAEEKLSEMTSKYEQSQTLIQSLHKRIQMLETELKKKNSETEQNIEDLDHAESIPILNNKQRGFTRTGPQFQPIKNKDESKFQCKVCDSVVESQRTLDSHLLEHEQLKISCDF